MSNQQNDIWNEQQAEISMERFDQLIEKIKAHQAKIAEYDQKIAERKRQLQEAGLCDISILPLIW